MTVTEKKPVPIYEVECCECKSKIHWLDWLKEEATANDR